VLNLDLKSFFIKDVNEYFKLNDILESIFQLDKEIPDNVFQKEFRNYLFEQFDNVLCGEFLTTIRGLAEKSKDDYVILAVLKPNPMDYYYKEFSYFNWLKLPLNLSNDDYWDILNEGPQNYEADAIMYNSFKIALFSPSKKWGILADRDFEISVIAFNDNVFNIDYLQLLESWLPVENDSVIKWMRYSFRPDFKVPKSFSQKLRKNYQGKQHE